MGEVEVTQVGAGADGGWKACELVFVKVEGFEGCEL